jgi:hypothetical protein
MRYATNIEYIEPAFMVSVIAEHYASFCIALPSRICDGRPLCTFVS